ncbi:MAG: hypothetical protein AAF573_07480 [Bacteroidota bacterium]
MLFSTILVIALVGYFLYQKRPKFLGTKVDYSFGNVELQKIKAKIDEGEYTSAEFLIQQLDSDELHQVIDHVTLNGTGDPLLRWKEELPNSQIADLFLGIYYLHYATLNRGNDFNPKLSNKQEDLFFEYAEQATELLETIDHDDVINAEAYARLIRILGLTDDYKGAQYFFDKCMQINPHHLWAHIEYAELTQPKWGVDLATTNQFIDDLTDEPLVNQVIYLKLVWDSVLSQQNLFGGTLADLKQQAKALLFEIDAEVNNTPPTSIQKYVLYNYMTVVSEEFGIKALNQKYNKLMNGNFTLYPFGIMK